MKVIKRNGSLADFNKDKIQIAITKAMRFSNGYIKENIAIKIADEIENDLLAQNIDTVSINEIEKQVYNRLIAHKQKETARCYENYRATREYQRQSNTIDNKVLGIIRGTNQQALSENSNKNDQIISTKRDLVAEEVSKDISLRMMLPPHIAQAHNDGIIHVHDLGHFLNKSHNCMLVNLEDMLQNGTVINGKLIEKPKSFRTACTIATQVIAQLASGQHGGQTITLTHLAPFVSVSKTKIKEKVLEESKLIDVQYTDEQLDAIVMKRLKEEVKDGVQTFQYQINTLQTSNG